MRAGGRAGERVGRQAGVYMADVSPRHVKHESQRAAPHGNGTLGNRALHSHSRTVLVHGIARAYILPSFCALALPRGSGDDPAESFRDFAGFLSAWFSKIAEGCWGL